MNSLFYASTFKNSEMTSTKLLKHKFAFDPFMDSFSMYFSIMKIKIDNSLASEVVLRNYAINNFLRIITSFQSG